MKILNTRNSDIATLRPAGDLRPYNVPQSQVKKALAWTDRQPALKRQTTAIVHTSDGITDLTEEEAAAVASSVNAILDPKLPPGPQPHGLFRDFALFSKNEFEGDPIDPVYGRTLSAMLSTPNVFTGDQIYEYMDCLRDKHPLWRLHVLIGFSEVDLALMIYPDCVRIDRDLFLRGAAGLQSQLERWAAAIDLYRAMIRLKGS